MNTGIKKQNAQCGVEGKVYHMVCSKVSLSHLLSSFSQICASEKKTRFNYLTKR